MSQSYSPRALRLPAFAAAPVCPDIYKIGLCELTLPRQNFTKPSALHFSPYLDVRGDQNLPETALARSRAELFVLQLPVVAPSRASGEVWVSVLLHQLGFNEPPRGSQVPAGQ